MNKEDIADFLGGKIIFVPDELRQRVSSSEGMSPVLRDLSYLIWYTVKNAPEENGSKGWKNIRCSKFNYAGSNRDIRKAIEWLEEEGFLKVRPSYLASAAAEKVNATAFAKGYWIRPAGKPEMVRLEKKSVLDGFTPYVQEDEACEYASECLSMAEVDRAGIEKEICKLIGEYEEFVASGACLEKGKKELANPLYTFGWPLLQLVHDEQIIKRGKKGNRLCSAMTYLSGEFRQYFSFDGEEMVELDMRCAQPCLLGNISGDEQLVEDAKNDDFYSGIRSSLGIDRAAAKKAYCKHAYGPINPGSELQQFMEGRYGKAHAYMMTSKRSGYEQDKQKGYNRFSHHMQQLEARLFIDGIYLRLRDENIPGITIHDSIMVRRSDSYRVQEIIKEEKERQGVRAHITIENAFDKSSEKSRERKEAWKR